MLNTQAQVRFGRKMAAGEGTITGFYDLSVGSKVELTVDHSEVSSGVTTRNDFSNGVAGAPEFYNANGGYLPGCYVWLDLAGTDRKKFRVIFERVSDSGYEPLSGNLNYTWVRWGKKW